MSSAAPRQTYWPRALSLTQPWGWLVVQPEPWGKSIENRSLGFSHKSFRGPFYVHASLRCTVSDYDRCYSWVYSNLGIDVAHRIPPYSELYFGGIIGKATVAGMVPPGEELLPRMGVPGVDYRWHMKDQCGFELVERAPLPFVDCKGALGFWRVPESVLPALRAAERPKLMLLQGGRT